ncbi:PIN domain-containing protein [Iningainema tapete]|uniref:Type II toxin-antitoxin system VapC family toxin n=1 Tax=Iningainema tapete BLCC-T55 TaxID=2748662 RepID=A0A8J7C7E5_9CYAN|nr:type II toxin-antitoxin system VapC family toxin [Iningainema tapete BLCC-T55]
MTETVYIETSIFGHLTARSTNNLILAANINITQDWWQNYSSSFVLYASEVVEDEAAKGDRAIATQRLELLRALMLLELTEEALELSQAFLSQSNLPPKAANDALHMALATVYGLDYLLTWNCKHMANAQIQRKLSQISSALGYVLPIICTPYELMGYNMEI